MAMATAHAVMDTMYSISMAMDMAHATAIATMATAMGQPTRYGRLISNFMFKFNMDDPENLLVFA